MSKLKIPFFRSIQHGTRFHVHKFRRSLFNKVSGAPLWTRQPTSVQFDTTNRPCPIKCEFCNPQSCFIDEVGDLPLSTIEHTCKEMVKHKMFVEFAHPFINTDPLVDKRMHKIYKILWDTLKCQVLTSTNGVLFSRRELLRSPYLTDVWFTISAASSKLYREVHGKPLFQQAIKTLYWLKKNKFWNQRLGLRFILYERNIHELPKWLKFFGGFQYEIRPLHYGGDRKASDKIKTPLNEIMKAHYLLQKQMFVDQKRPCNCFHNLSIGFDGSFMQCCDLPYKYNWGHVEEIDLLETWHKRLDLGLDHPGCKGCNQVNPEWKTLFEDCVWNS